MTIITVLTIEVDRNINSIRKKLGKFVTGYDDVGEAKTVDIEVAGTTIKAITKYQRGVRQPYRIYCSKDYDKFATVIEIEMEGEGTKEILVDFVKRVQEFFAKSKDRTNYSIHDYGLEIRQTLSKKSYQDFTGSLL